MLSQKPKNMKRRGRGTPRMQEGTDTKVTLSAVEKAIKENPDVRVVLEIAQHARELEATQIPVDFESGTTTTTATAQDGQAIIAA